VLIKEIDLFLICRFRLGRRVFDSGEHRDEPLFVPILLIENISMQRNARGKKIEKLKRKGKNDNNCLKRLYHAIL